ncbi:hypothetical protein LINGRAHAP2_LOCUS30286, partial [Linum grandiflorum]
MPESSPVARHLTRGELLIVEEHRPVVIALTAMHVEEDHGACVLCEDATGSRFMELDLPTAILRVRCPPEQYHRLNRRAQEAINA